MGQLKALEDLQAPPPEVRYTCEVCGQVVNGKTARAIAIVYRYAGEAPGFQCPAEQHWGCCHDHAWQAAVACHDEHVKPLHDALQEGILRMKALAQIDQAITQQQSS